MSVIYIYGLVCPITNKIMYVGRAKNTESRFKQHIRDVEQGNNSTKSIWIRDLLKENLLPSVTIIEECPVDMAVEREVHWIRHHRSINPSLKNSQSGEKSNRHRNKIILRIELTPKEFERFRRLKEKYRMKNEAELVRCAIDYIILERPSPFPVYVPMKPEERKRAEEEYLGGGIP